MRRRAGAALSRTSQPAPRAPTEAEALIDRLQATFRVVSPGREIGASPSSGAEGPVLADAVVDRVDREGAWLVPQVREDVARTAPRRATVLLPANVTDPFRLTDDSSAMTIDVTLRAGRAQEGEAARGFVVYRQGHASGADVVHRVTPYGTEDYLVFWQAPREPAIAYALAFRQSVKGLRLVANTLELLDAGGVPRLRIAPPHLVDIDGRVLAATLVLGGCDADTSPAPPWGRAVTHPGASSCEIRVTWDSQHIRYPALLDPSWSNTADMTQARQDHTATLLPSGHVLAAGGFAIAVGTLDSAELYDPVTATWTPTGSLSFARVNHTATPLANGDVLAIGGDGPAFGTVDALDKVEVYEVATGTWVPAADMPTPRTNHATATLPDGRIFTSGGQTATQITDTAEIYDPAANTWTPAASMPGPRHGHTATTLLSGRVLIVGGTTDPTTLHYVPAPGGWLQAGVLDGRSFHTATLLSNGDVLVAGGDVPGAGPVATAATYRDGKWTDTFPMHMSRAGHTATLLGGAPADRVLVAGGLSPLVDCPINVTATAEVFDPVANGWRITSNMFGARREHAASLLPDGTALVAGGVRLVALPCLPTLQATVPNCELFRRQPLGAPCAGGGDCESDRCVDGVCCDTSCGFGAPMDCLGCSIAAGAPMDGTCAPTPGTTCTAPNGTGQCTAPGDCQGTITCDAGWGDCDGLPGNGCEVHLPTDPQNCGACGTVCLASNATPFCVNSVCKPLCNPGFCDANGDPTDGCETNFTCGQCSCDDGNDCTDDKCMGSCTHTPDTCGNGTCGFNDASCNCPADCGGDGDGDGLSDAMESGPFDVNCDGLADLDLPALGAKPDHLDIFVQVDYMVAPDHSHILVPSAIDMVTNAFANAPVNNPDGVPGIALHILIGNALPESFWIYFEPTLCLPDPLCPGCTEIDFDTLKAVYFDPVRRPAFHYAISAHTIDIRDANCTLLPGLSGQAELPGNDLIIDGETLFPVPIPPPPPFLELYAENQARILMHELGHNLGLRHGGQTNSPNFKPNYLSVMSYSGAGIDPATGKQRLDYSREVLPPFPLPPLDENALRELNGISNGAILAPYYCGVGGVRSFAFANAAIDWNCNGAIDDSPVTADITGESPLEPLTGWEDWSQLNYAFQCTADYQDLIHLPETLPEELDADTARRMHVLFPTRIVGVDIAPGCDTNAIAIDGIGDIVVAVRSETDFRAGDIDRTTIRFAGASPFKSTLEDVDGDGDLDLVARFHSADVQLSPQATHGALTAAFPSSQSIFGTDHVTMIAHGTDNDGDGVLDGCDACPDTPLGEVTNCEGCPAGQTPIAVCRDITVAANGTCIAAASVDAGSFDPGGGPITLIQQPPGPYPLGATEVMLTVSNGLATDACAGSVTVRDETAPDLAVTLSPAVLTPANHKMRNVTASIQVHDACDANVGAALVRVVSSEPDDAPGGGDGNTTGDIQAPNASSISLRAERDAIGPGRVYTLTFRAVDRAGNTAERQATVSVP